MASGLQVYDRGSWIRTCGLLVMSPRPARKTDNSNWLRFDCRMAWPNGTSGQVLSSRKKVLNQSPAAPLVVNRTCLRLSGPSGATLRYGSLCMMGPIGRSAESRRAITSRRWRRAREAALAVGREARFFPEKPQ